MTSDEAIYLRESLVEVVAEVGFDRWPHSDLWWELQVMIGDEAFEAGDLQAELAARIAEADPSGRTTFEWMERSSGFRSLALSLYRSFVELQGESPRLLQRRDRPSRQTRGSLPTGNS